MPPVQSFLRKGLAAPCLIRLTRPLQVSYRDLTREPCYACKAYDCKSPYSAPPPLKGLVPSSSIEFTFAWCVSLSKTSRKNLSKEKNLKEKALHMVRDRP